MLNMYLQQTLEVQIRHTKDSVRVFVYSCVRGTDPHAVQHKVSYIGGVDCIFQILVACDQYRPKIDLFCHGNSLKKYKKKTIVQLIMNNEHRLILKQNQVNMCFLRLCCRYCLQFFFYIHVMMNYDISAYRLSELLQLYAK